MTISREVANVIVHMMTEPQLARVMSRMKRYSGAFPDIRDVIAQAVHDELVAIIANLPPTVERLNDRALPTFSNPPAGRSGV